MPTRIATLMSHFPSGIKYGHLLGVLTIAFGALHETMKDAVTSPASGFPGDRSFQYPLCIKSLSWRSFAANQEYLHQLA